MSKLSKGGSHRKPISVSASKIKRITKEYGLRRPKTKGNSIYVSNVLGKKRKRRQAQAEKDSRISFYQKNKKGLKTPKGTKIKTNK